MPARGPEIAVRISAKSDELSAAVASIKKSLAGLPAVARDANRRMEAIGGGRGAFQLDRIGGGLSSAGQRASGFARGGLGALSSAASTVPGFGELAGAASVAGTGQMMTSFAGAGIELQNTARLAGTTAQGLNSLRGAARLVGLTAGDADSAMLGLNHTLQDATFGRNPQAARMFQQFGIDFGNMTDGARSAESALPQVVAELTKIAKQNPLAAERLAAAWGIPASALPMLIRGQEALQANRREVENIFGSFDKYEASSERFTHATGRLSLASEKLGMTILESLEPHLTPMLTQLLHFVEAHNQDIGRAFDNIGTAVANVDWKAVGDGVSTVGSALAFATKNTDLLTTAMGVLAANRLMRSLAGRGLFSAAGVSTAAAAAVLSLRYSRRRIWPSLLAGRDGRGAAPERAG